MEKFNYQNKTIKYIKEGEGEPIIMLHNGASFHGIWLHQINEFKKDYTVYALDLMSFGESDYSKESSPIEFHYHFLKEFISTLQIEKPIFFGTCIGASLSLYYANKHPLEIKKCILFNICPGLELLRNPLAKYWYQLAKTYPHIHQLNNWIIRKIMNSDFEYNRLPALLYGNKVNTADPVFLQLKKYYRTQKQKNARLDLLNNIGSYTVEKFITNQHQLPKLQIFWGEENKIVPLEVGLRLNTLLRPSEFYSIKNTGHLMMLENPTLINKKIRQFLK